MSLFFIILLIFTLNVFSQNKRDYKWVMGNSYVGLSGGDIIDFGNNRSIDESYLAFSMGSICVNICDTEGNLLMYSNGCAIADYTHNIMEGGDSINYGESWEDFCPYKYSPGYPVSQNSLILPDPGNDTDNIRNGYYLLHKRTELLKEPYIHSWCPGVSYSYVDMNANNGRGRVIEKNKLIFETTSLAQGYMSACQHANGRDWWIIQIESDTNTFYKLLLRQDTILVDSQSMVGSFPHGYNRGQAVFAPDGSKWIGFNPIDKVIIYDFDRLTGKLSNLQRVNPQDSGIFVGVAVSSNSRFAYLSALHNLYQIDLWEEDIQSSLTHIAHIDGFADPTFISTFSLAQLAPDCRIYIVNGGTNNYLHVINKPNEKGKACDFQQHSFYLPNRNYNGSLPNFPHFRIDEEDICDSTISFLPKIYHTKGKINPIIYPNPAKEQINIYFDSPVTEQLNYELFDIQGEKFKYGLLPLLQTEINIDISSINSGIYFLKLTNNNQELEWSGKVIIEE